MSKHMLATSIGHLAACSYFSDTLAAILKNIEQVAARMCNVFKYVRAESNFYNRLPIQLKGMSILSGGNPCDC